MTYREYLSKCVLAFIFIAQVCVGSLSVQAAQLDASFTIESDWGRGYQVLVTVKNPSTAPTTSWRASFDLEASGETIGSLWNANHTVNGATVQVTNPSWTGGGVIPAHGRVAFGFVVYNATPKTRALLNLQATGDGSPTPRPTPRPTPTPAPTPTPTPQRGAFVEGYWESWNSTNSISSIVNMKNDRICVSFITFTRTGGSTFSVSGLDASPETLRQLVSAAHAAGRKVKASVGGASYGQGQFLQSVADANGMAQAVAQYVQQNGLDGVDYDIEDSPAANLQIALLKRTRELLPNSIISYTPMTPASTTQPFTQVIRDGHQYVDYISMMCYNAGPGYNYQQDVQALIAMGVPAAKVVVGLMPGRDDMGEMTSLDEIKAACNYINQKGLGGIMFWSLNRDLSNVTGLGASAATNASYAILHP